MVPFPPFDDRPVTPKIGHGANYGATRRTGNTFWHTMVGDLAGTDSWFRNKASASLTPWGIGGLLDGRLDGKIYRFYDYTNPAHSNIMPWSSGPWIAPGEGEGQAYVDTYGVSGINGLAEAIENSGMPGTVVTAKQWTSLIWLTAAILHAGKRESEDQRLWRMFHREICIKSGKECPFPRITRYASISLQAVRALMAHYEGVPNVQQLWDIGGNKIVLPFNNKPVPPNPPPAGKPIFVNFEPDRTFTIDVPVANVRQWGGTDSAIKATLKYGAKVVADGYYHGQDINGQDKWIVQANDPRGRIHESVLKEVV